MADPEIDEATALALRAAAGDRIATAEFIRAFQRDIWRYLAFHVSPREADDLTQETFLRAFIALPRFEGRSTARTWLLVIARRVVVDHFRRRSARPQLSAVQDWTQLADSAVPVAADAAFTETVELDLLLGELSAERREALVLTQILGLSYAEAALVCHCQIGTIRSRVARARDDMVRHAGGGQRSTRGEALPG